MKWHAYGPLDTRIDEVVKYHYMTGHRVRIDEALHYVLNGIPGTSVRGVRVVFQQIAKTLPGWHLDKILMDHTKDRLRRCLSQDEARQFGDKIVYVRRFHNYPDEYGRRWYQPLHTMTVDDLVKSVRSRHAQKAVLEMHIDVLEHLIAEARRFKAKTVGEVLDTALPPFKAKAKAAVG